MGPVCRGKHGGGDRGIDMYMTRIHAMGTGWRGGNGERLVMAGNLPYKSGDTVWTDGRIIYGWTGRDEPTRQWSYGEEGIPIHNPGYGMYLFRGRDNCKRYADDKGWYAFANDGGSSCGFSTEIFINVMDMDIGKDGSKWVLSWKDAQYVLNTPHQLAWESGGFAKPEGRSTVVAVWQEQGNISVVKQDNDESTTQTFRESAKRLSVVEAGEATESDTTFAVTHGGVSERRSLKEYADAAIEAFNATAAEKLWSSVHLENCVNSMTLRIVDGKIDSDGKLSLYILAQMKGFAFRDMQKEGLRGNLLQSYSSSPNGAGRIHLKWEYTVDVSPYPVDATFCAEFTCTLHLHVDGETVEKVFEAVNCPGYEGGYNSSGAFADASNVFGGINHAREDGSLWFATSGDMRTYYSTLYEVDVHDGGALNGIIFPETKVCTSSPSLTVCTRVEGFDAIAEENAWPFQMPIQDGYYAVISPSAIGLSYGSLDYYDMRTYLGCFQQVFGPSDEMVVDTEDWPYGLLSVRAIVPIDEEEETYLIHAVSSPYDYNGRVYTYNKKEGVQPVEVPVSDNEEETGTAMMSTNTRLRWMKHARALKRM